MENVTAIDPFVLQWESELRLGFFVGIFIIMLIWELIAPRRRLSLAKASRWSHNLGLMLINSILLRLLFHSAAVGIAYGVNQKGWGLFNQLELGFGLELVLGLLLLDLAIYLQHRLMHQQPLLWRLHRVHHADLDIDLTTGSRFHPLEIIFSMLFKWLVLILLGPSLLTVVIFEIVLSGMAVFNHANARLPIGLDRLLRWLLVTPDMHRVHHSVMVHETDSNYGFNLSLWDRVFKTYRQQPEKGHTEMQIGLAEFRDERQVERLPGMLSLPFVRRP